MLVLVGGMCGLHCSGIWRELVDQFPHLQRQLQQCDDSGKYEYLAWNQGTSWCWKHILLFEALLLTQRLYLLTFRGKNAATYNLQDGEEHIELRRRILFLRKTRPFRIPPSINYKERDARTEMLGVNKTPVSLLDPKITLSLSHHQHHRAHTTHYYTIHCYTIHYSKPSYSFTNTEFLSTIIIPLPPVLVPIAHHRELCPQSLTCLVTPSSSLHQPAPTFTNQTYSRFHHVSTQGEFFQVGDLVPDS